MKRLVLPLAVLLLACATAPARAQNQLGSRPNLPFVRPPVSPYINLFRGGNAGVNYFGVVRPQLETQAALQQLQLQATNPNTPNIDAYGPAGRGILDTGTPSRFLNYQQYFMTMGRPGSTTGTMMFTQPQIGARRY